jgi:hypothetical protein
MIVDGRVTEILDLPVLLEGRNAHRGTTLGASAGAAS